MKTNLKNHWREYLIEAWGLGTFMVSAVLFTIIVEHPDSPIKQALIDNGMIRRLIVGIAMGLTAIAIMYSPWGKKSGAHLNPAVTLSFLRLGKISRNDAFFYVLFQFIGGYVGVVIFQLFLSNYSMVPEVNYAVTVPGDEGNWLAFLMETLISFLLFVTVLFASNNEKIATYTPVLAGIWLAVFITFEAPYSGMSINPARTIASAIPADVWSGVWIYFFAPPLGMLLGTELYRKSIHDHSKKIKCNMTCDGEYCLTHKDRIINK